MKRNEQTNRLGKKRIGSNYIGQAADRCLFTGEILQLIDTGTFACCVSALDLLRPSSDNLITLSSLGVPILIPILVRTPAQHRSPDSRTPALTRSTNSGLQVAGSQEHARTPNR